MNEQRIPTNNGVKVVVLTLLARRSGYVTLNNGQGFLIILLEIQSHYFYD